MNPDPFAQQENDDVQKEWANGNSLLDAFENILHESNFSDEISSLPTCTTPTLIPDLELNAMIRSLLIIRNVQLLILSIVGRNNI